MNDKQAAEAILRKELDDATDYAEQMRIIAGYKAGLKRGAEIAFNESTIPVPWYRYNVWHIAERIEQAILKEMKGD